MAGRRNSTRGVAPLWITDSTVAALLGISRSTVWRWLDDELIPPPRRVGGRTLWCHSEIEPFARCRSMAEFARLRRQHAEVAAAG